MVDHLGLPLPPQSLPDCDFFMLTRLESWLTGEFLRPELWQFKTSLMRCWTDLQANRQLRHDCAIQDVMRISLDKFRQGRGQGAIVPDAVAEARALVSLNHALTEFWERVFAALPDAEKQRRMSKRKELKRLLLDEVWKRLANGRKRLM